MANRSRELYLKSIGHGKLHDKGSKPYPDDTRKQKVASAHLVSLLGRALPVQMRVVGQ